MFVCISLCKQIDKCISKRLWACFGILCVCITHATTRRNPFPEMLRRLGCVHLNKSMYGNQFYEEFGIVSWPCFVFSTQPKSAKNEFRKRENPRACAARAMPNPFRRRDQLRSARRNQIFLPQGNGAQCAKSK